MIWYWDYVWWGIGWAILLIALCISPLFSGCVVPTCEAVAVEGPSLQCLYQGDTVYAGTFDTKGEGLADVLKGRWVLQKYEGDVICIVEFP